MPPDLGLCSHLNPSDSPVELSRTAHSTGGMAGLRELKSQNDAAFAVGEYSENLLKIGGAKVNIIGDFCATQVSSFAQ
jgi:hypothetical protein